MQKLLLMFNKAHRRTEGHGDEVISSANRHVGDIAVRWGANDRRFQIVFCGFELSLDLGDAGDIGTDDTFKLGLRLGDSSFGGGQSRFGLFTSVTKFSTSN